MENLLPLIEDLARTWRSLRERLPEASHNSFQMWKRVELTYHSNALEGNTLSAAETADLLTRDLTAGGKTLREHLEAKNHDKAFSWIEQRAMNALPIRERDILTLHELVLKGIDDDWAGRYRNGPVRIAGSSVLLPNAMKVSSLMEELERQLADDWESPVVCAVTAHERLVSIHPFFDGNGRTARLLMNLILLQSDYPPAVIPVTHRQTYLQSLEKLQTGQGRTDYEQFMYTCLRRDWEERIRFIQEHSSDFPGLSR